MRFILPALIFTAIASRADRGDNLGLAGPLNGECWVRGRRFQTQSESNRNRVAWRR
jgi:hypothetical protein